MNETNIKIDYKRKITTIAKVRAGICVRNQMASYFVFSVFDFEFK
jgi:hypothetical protein